jgi:hypothetical protein
MMSQVPVSLDKVGNGEIDREILRVGIIAEYDAINLYNQRRRSFFENSHASTCPYATSNERKVPTILFNENPSLYWRFMLAGHRGRHWNSVDG